jgi:hypothetical protein
MQINAFARYPNNKQTYLELSIYNSSDDPEAILKFV